jgi:hypothetical protein
MRYAAIRCRADQQSEQAQSSLTQMISGNAESVLGVLTMYIQAQGEYHDAMRVAPPANFRLDGTDHDINF